MTKTAPDFLKKSIKTKRGNQQFPIRSKRDRPFRSKEFRFRRKNIHVIFLLPNILTSFNIACGVISIMFAIDGQFVIAAGLILMAGFFDMVDGKVARMLHSSSNFGLQLDSLADLISFGLASSVLFHQILYHDLTRLSASLVLIYTLCTALRLARYNSQTASGHARTHFVGLPCPVPSCFLAAIVLVSNEFEFSLNQSIILIPLHILIIVLAGLMVSTVRYPDFSSYLVDKKYIYHYNVIFVLVLCVAVLRVQEVLFLLLGTYIVVGPFMAMRDLAGHQTSDAAVEEEPSAAKAIDYAENG